MFKNAIIAIVGLILIAVVYAWWQSFNAVTLVTVNSYEECVAKGYPVMESYPMQCKTPDGRTFVSSEDLNQYAE